MLRRLTVGAAPSHLIFFLHKSHDQTERPSKGACNNEEKLSGHVHSASVTAQVSLPAKMACATMGSPHQA